MKTATEYYSISIYNAVTNHLYTSIINLAGGRKTQPNKLKVGQISADKD